jgi:glucose/arabinose dehydrogenase
MKNPNWTISTKLIQNLFTLLVFGFLMSCNKNMVTVPESPYPISDDAFTTETIIEGFKIPYGLAIVSENEYFITDRVGKFFHFKDGNLTEVEGIPEVLTFGDPGIPAIMHGGLMDVSLYPNYQTIPWIYISYLGEDALCRVLRFKIQNNNAIQFDTIFESRTSGYYGNGMRIVWEDETHFFLNIGASTLSTYTNPVLIAQDLNEDWGKIHRLNEDGSIPSDNPILEGMSNPSTIWSYGHRD